MASGHLIVLSTCPDRGTADGIADALVAGRHAACVNIVPGLTSVYRWQGKVHHDTELLLVIKTTEAAYPGLEAEVRRLHPDELPELVAVPLQGGLAGYLDWMTQETNQ